MLNSHGLKRARFKEAYWLLNYMQLEANQLVIPVLRDCAVAWEGGQAGLALTCVPGDSQRRSVPGAK